ncbi:MULTISPECIES: branched-chain amino acid ABC transporter permease [Catellatospora]|uniref:Branched-chain amino acid ABC transporter permease n=1 Tax=Catellatospora chokoriensis TaxID=310353 RepID=A0A8J3JZV1_9ACTN|nr:branched-chain amino acid ABC transporter permease [Catellatospora chokoriensis]GIF86794.1 branched-chain amino acid ABC transporter permease [Catellatospora chokoriensis]
MNFDDLIQGFPDLTTTGLAQGSIYALVALGYTLVYGVLRLINFAHSEVFMFGTFAALWTWGLMGYDSNSTRPDLGTALLLVLVSLVVASLFSGGVAMVVEAVAYRPLRKRNAPPLVFLISAIGASFVLAELMGAFTERRQQGIPGLLPGEPLFSAGGWTVYPLQLMTFVVALAVMFGLDWFVSKTRFGRGIRAVAQDADTAALMGVNKGRVIALVFLLGGLLAGVAAVFYSMKQGNTRFNVGFLIGLKAFSAAVLGGIGNLRGALLGGLLLGLVESYGAALFGSNWTNVIAFVVLLVLLMFRPTGLLGESLGRARA